MNGLVAAKGIALFLFGSLTAWCLANPVWGGPGMTWDEAFYYPAFQDAAAWTELFFSNPARALSSDAIYQGWQEIHELPPVVKWLGALAVSLGGDGWWRLAAMRLFPAVAFGGCLLLLLACGWRLTGRERWGWLAVALYALHPRVLGHAQFAATETVFAAVMLLVVYLAIRGCGGWWWRAALAAGLGLALATKVNGLVLLAVVVFWLTTRRLVDPRLRRLGTGWRQWREEAITLGVILAGAPLLALALWPWMWDETGARVAEYVRFILEHAHQGLWFFGQKWNFRAPAAPPYYPFVITHLTTPVILLVVFWAATLTGLVRFVWRRGLPQRAYLVALATLAPIAAASLPGTPKYDGVRLFFPMFPAAALLGVIGLQWLERYWRVKRGAKRGWGGLALAAGILLLAIPVARPTIDYYNRPVRWATAGERIFPFEQTYWGNAVDPRAIGDLNEELPPEAAVKTRAMQTLIFRIYREWGLLRQDVQINGPPPYDAHLIHTRRGFWGRADWTIFANRAPLEGWGKGVGGEPLLYLYDGRPPGAAVR